MNIYIEDRTPYTYLIGWSKLDRWYYGVRFAKGCHPKDLWNPYKTSSNYVKEFIAINGEPDIIQIRKVFYKIKDVREATNYENKILRKLKVRSNLRWINESEGKTPYITRRKISEETRAKMSASRKGRVVSDETRAKLSIAGKGRIFSEEARDKISKSNKGKTFSDETRAKMSEAKMGKSLSDETKSNMSKARTGVALSDYHREKISIGHKGKVKTKEHVKKIADSQRGREVSAEVKAKISASSKGKSKSEESNIKRRNSMKGRIPSEETKAKMRRSKEESGYWKPKVSALMSRDEPETHPLSQI